MALLHRCVLCVFDWLVHFTGVKGGGGHAYMPDGLTPMKRQFRGVHWGS
jgi:hypothetical protein